MDSYLAFGEKGGGEITLIVSSLFGSGGAPLRRAAGGLFDFLGGQLAARR